MSKVRADLVGAVLVRNADGQQVSLVAGDDVPDGYELGDHLLEERESDKGSGEPPRSGKGSGKEEWAAYADTLGVAYDEGATRDDIVAAVDASRAGA